MGQTDPRSGAPPTPIVHDRPGANHLSRASRHTRSAGISTSASDERPSLPQRGSSFTPRATANDVMGKNESTSGWRYLDGYARTLEGAPTIRQDCRHGAETRHHRCRNASTHPGGRAAKTRPARAIVLAVPKKRLDGLPPPLYLFLIRNTL